jgi:flagellin
MDVDVAEETTEYTSVQILVQAATSVLAQANERPQQVLQLLQ